jgi:hypothetical protein
VQDINFLILKTQLMNEYKTDQLNNLGLKIDYEVNNNFNEATKWGKFIAIVSFIFAGILLIMGVLGSSTFAGLISKVYPSLDALGEMGTGILIGIVLVVVAFMVVLYSFLYKFATKVRLGLATEDSNMLTEGLSSLKTFFIISAVVGALGILMNIINLFK